MTDLVWRRGAEQRSDSRLPVFKFQPVSLFQWLRGASPKSSTRVGLGEHSPLRRIELGSDWTVLPGADCGLRVDYVVVGPAGFFVVNTSIKPGKKVWVDESVIWVNGRATNLVNETCSAALEASAKLTVTTGEIVNVTPVVIVPNPATLDCGGDPARRIPVVTAELFTQWLLAGARQLSPEAVAYFTMVAEERDTWSIGVAAA